MVLSRRAFVGAAAGGCTAVLAGGVGVGSGLLPGQAPLLHHLGLDGPDGVVPAVTPGPVVEGVLVSAARQGRRVGWAVARPPGTSGPLPVAVVLHGRGASHRTAFDRRALGLDRFLAAAVADGVAPFALASIDGGTRYWHRRADGDDPGAMVLDEFVPLLRAQGLDTDRLAFLGWSMGGFGALRLGGLLGPGRVRAVGALSPALFRRFADASPGSFDSAADLAAVTVLGRQRDLDGIAVRVDCGLGDPFCSAARDYVAGFARPPAGGFERGDHDRGYWRRLVPAHLAFLGRHLA